jgi:hypothetical protein
MFEELTDHRAMLAALLCNRACTARAMLAALLCNRACTALDYITMTAILVNDQLDAQFLFLYIYFNSLLVSSNLVLITRRINCINTTSGMCHYDRLLCRLGRNLPTCTLDGQSDAYQMLY